MRKFKELDLDLKVSYVALSAMGILNMVFALIPYTLNIEFLRFTSGIVNILYVVLILVFFGKVKIAEYLGLISPLISLIGVFLRPFFITLATVLMILIGISLLFLLIKTRHIIVLMVAFSYILQFIGMILIRLNFYTLFAMLNVFLASLYLSFFISIGRYSITSAFYIWLYTYGQSIFIAQIIYLTLFNQNLWSAFYEFSVLLFYAVLLYNAYILTLVYNRRKDKPSKYLTISLLSGAMLVLISSIKYALTSLIPPDLAVFIPIIDDDLVFIVQSLVPILIGFFALAALNLKQAKWAPSRGASIISFYIGAAIAIIFYDAQKMYIDAQLFYVIGLLVLLFVGVFEFAKSAYALYKLGKKTKALRSLIIPILFISLYLVEWMQRLNMLIIGAIIFICIGSISLYYSPRFRKYLSELRKKEVKP